VSKISLLEKNIKNLPAVLEQYENELEAVKDILTIKGKRLELANSEQCTWLQYYDQKRIELHTLVKYLEAKVSATRGSLFRSYTEKSQRDLSDRAKDKYIDNEKAYLTVYELFLEVKELHDHFNSVVEAFKQRGYSLNNITKIRIASLEDAEI